MNHEAYPSNHKRLTNVGLALGQPRKRWASVSQTAGERQVFAGIAPSYLNYSLNNSLQYYYG